MITTINLLPTEERAAQSTQSAEALKKISIIAIFVFVIGALSLGGFVLFLSRDIGAARNRVDLLKNQVAEFADVESRLVLTQARLNKLRAIIANSSEGNLAILASLGSQLPEGASVTETEVASDKLKIGVSVVDTSQLSRVFSVFGEDGEFQKVMLRTLSFNPLLGYFVSLDLESKK
jgi:hypothetical protein